jgi:hypothetical protein
MLVKASFNSNIKSFFYCLRYTAGNQSFSQRRHREYSGELARIAGRLVPPKTMDSLEFAIGLS